MIDLGNNATSRLGKKLVTIMSLPVRSCLCRRHSERLGGPLGPRQWLRLLRRSTCSKRGSVRTVFFFLFYHPNSEFGTERTKWKEARWTSPRSTQVHVRNNSKRGSGCGSRIYNFFLILIYELRKLKIDVFLYRKN